LLETGIAVSFRASTAVATAASIPRRIPIGLAPAVTFLIPSRTIACVKTVAVGDGIAAPGTINTGKEELAADLAILSGAYKRGDEVPVGLAKTLKIIQHRNKITTYENRDNH